jgi:hypothetical protein
MRWTKLDLTCIYFQKKLIITLNLHRPFIAAELIAWIFFIFQPSKIRVSPTGVISSLSPPRCHLSSGWYHHVVTPCHASFQWGKYELAASASSFGNASSRHLPSHVTTEVLNPHHRRRSLSSGCSTPTLLCYKKVISTLVTLSSSLNHVFILSPPKSEHHIIRAPLAIFIPFHRCPTRIVPPHNDTHGDKLADTHSLSKQLVGMWIYVKI